MSFKIIVCIKQVPDTNDIRWTENNTIQRDGLDSIINPQDIAALQYANNFKYILSDVEVIAVTMGPLQAIEALKEAIAISVDDAYLLSDRRFSGADTLATAYTLSAFIKKFHPDFNLILCGYQALDGDTAQTPSSLAEKLSIPQITGVIGIKDISNNNSTWIRETNDTKDEIKIKHPAMISVANNNLEVIPKIDNYINAQNTEIKIVNADDINVDLSKIGLKGSPTQVKNAYRPIINRQSENIDLLNASYKDVILSEIDKCRLL